MTKVFDVGDFWIETFNFDRVNLINASQTDDVTLDKPGRIVGISASIDSDETPPADARNLSVLCKQTDDSEISYGDALTQLRIYRANSSGMATDVGAHIIVFLKK